MDYSLLSRLSAEIRNRIWLLAVTGVNDDDDEDKGDNVFCLDDGEGTQPSITRTCRQIRAESLLMFYANSEFLAWDVDFETPFGAPGPTSEKQLRELIDLICRWLHAVPREYHVVTKKVHIRTHVDVSWWMMDWDIRCDSWEILVRELNACGYFEPRLTASVELCKEGRMISQWNKVRADDGTDIKQAFQDLGLNVELSY